MTIKVFGAAVISEVAPATTKYVSEFGVMCEYSLDEDITLDTNLLLQIIDIREQSILFDFHNCNDCLYIDGTIIAGLPSQREIQKDSGDSLGTSKLVASYENRTFEFDVRIEKDFSDDIVDVLSRLTKINELTLAYHEKAVGNSIGFRIKVPGSTEILTFTVVSIGFSLPDDFMSHHNLMAKSGTSIDSVHITIETLPLGFTEWTTLIDDAGIDCWTYGSRNSTLIISSTAIEGDVQAPLRVTIHNDTGNRFNGFAINRYSGRQFAVLSQQFLNPLIPIAGTNLYSQLGSEWEYEEKQDTSEVDKNKTSSGFYARFNVIGLNQVQAARDWHTLAVTSHVMRPEMNGIYMVTLRCRHNIPAIGGTPNIFDFRMFAVYDSGNQQMRRLIMPHKTLLSRGNNWTYMKCGLVRIPLNFRMTRSYTKVVYHIDVRIVNYNSVEPPLTPISQEKLDIDFMVLEKQDATFFAQSANQWDDGLPFVTIDSMERTVGIKQAREDTITGTFVGGYGGMYPVIIPGVDNLLNFRIDSDVDSDEYTGSMGRTANADSHAKVNVQYMPQYLHIRGLR